MGAAAALCLLLAPGLVRAPVGSGDWERIEDPLQRRIASLLCGEPVVSGTVVVVPLYARVPSEARGGQGVRWLGDGITGRLLFEDGRPWLRVLNPNPYPVFVAAGTVFEWGGREVCVARDAVVPAEFAALFPAFTANGVAGESQELHPLAGGVLGPRVTGALLHPSANSGGALAEMLQGQGSYKALLQRPRLRVKHGQVVKRCTALENDLSGTVVGAVFFVGDEPVAAHVFAGHELFWAALPDLLQGVTAQARAEEARLGGPNELLLAAKLGSHAGRALALLRNFANVEGEWSESYGAGFEVTLMNESEGVVGHAVVDHSRTVLHAGLYPLGWWWPAGANARPAGGRAPEPPRRPPDQGNDETAPGVIERKARPSVSEQRERGRKPEAGPSSGGRPR